MINIAVFASGSGTNAENIIKYFSNNQHIRIKAIYTNNSKAGVIERAKKWNVPVQIFSKTTFENGEAFAKKLQADEINFIVLAGFLLLIPVEVIDAYRNRIINIHPALLPLHGGKGFYGNN